MLRSLAKGFSKVLNNFIGKKKIDLAAFDSLLSGIRNALIEVDVALEVADYLINRIKDSSYKKDIFSASDSANLLVEIIKEELINIVSNEEASSSLNIRGNPAVIMLIGNNGVGKTTSCAKIAHYIKSKYQKSVLLVSLDKLRPAAQEQLRVMANLASVDYFSFAESTLKQSCLDSLSWSRQKGYEVVIYDTAGCSNVDLESIELLAEVKDTIGAKEVLLVADALTGQDALTSAKCFADIVGISGVILTKMDADSKGAAALSIKYVTNKSIKFIGVGEDIKDLELFDPKGMALRILDMGDLETLTKKLDAVVDSKTRNQDLEKMQEGRFNLQDYESYIMRLVQMGGIAKIVGLLPNASKLIDHSAFDKGGIDKTLLKQQSIIRSMTPKERRIPQLLTHSRKKRIAAGSGVTVAQVEALLKQFHQMSTLIKGGPKSIRSTAKKFF
jgi:signal recognition particle subunit SRP54